MTKIFKSINIKKSILQSFTKRQIPQTNDFTSRITSLSFVIIFIQSFSSSERSHSFYPSTKTPRKTQKMLHLFFYRPSIHSKDNFHAEKRHFLYEYQTFRFNCFVPLIQNIQIEEEAKKLSKIAAKWHLEAITITIYRLDVEFLPLMKKYSTTVLIVLSSQNRFVTEVKVENFNQDQHIFETVVECRWPFLIQLDVDHNYLYSRSLLKLCKQECRYLRELRLQKNNICSQGIIALRKKTYPYLEICQLSSNPLGNKGLKELCKGAYWPKLKTLRLKKVDATTHIFGYLKKNFIGSRELKILLSLKHVPITILKDVPQLNFQYQRQICVRKQAEKNLSPFQRFTYRKNRNTIAKIGHLPVRMEKFKAFREYQEIMFDFGQTSEERPEQSIQQYRDKLHYYCLQKVMQIL